jgi:lipoate-protein ligase B
VLCRGEHIVVAGSIAKAIVAMVMAIEELVDVRDLGRIGYAAAHEEQLRTVRELIEGERSRGVLFVCEHDPVITIGRAAVRDPWKHVRADEEAFRRAGTELVQTDRGGDVTWHGPGQLVAYPVLPMWQFRRSAEWLVRMLEEATIGCLSRFGITGCRVEGRSGVWVGDDRPEKICALGVAFRRWVSYHGLALNVDPDLTAFDRIVPCGIADAGVTSMSRFLNRRVLVDDVKPAMIDAFADLLGDAYHRAG